MFRRIVTITSVVAAIAVAGGCSTPKTAAGTLDEGKQRVTELVLEAAHALPARARFDEPTKVGTNRCQKTAFGYVVGSTGAHRAQVPILVHTSAIEESPTALVNVIGRAWRAAGYDLDTTRLDETQFPQLRAHTPDGYDVVATAFTNAPQIDLYAVSPCLRGS